MAAILILGCAAAALAALVVGATLLLEDARFASRLAVHVGGAEPRNGLRFSRPDLRPLLQSLVRLGERAGRGSLEAESGRKLRTSLAQAGFYSEGAPQVFFGIRAAAAAGLSIAAAMMALALNQPAPLLVLWAALGANIGLFGPNILLNRRTRARSAAMRLALPDVVDLLVVCVEAGATLTAGLQRVTLEFADLYPIVHEQFGFVLMEMQAGSSRSQALARLAERCPAEDVAGLVGMITQSEAVGASVGGALRTFSQDVRKKRQLEAERKAAELPVKITIPLALFIFPAMGIVLFGPALVRLMNFTVPN